MKNEPLTITTPTDREVVITRSFNADPDLVFDGLTKPDLITLWCCPDGWTFDVCESDIQVGGKWRFQMRQPGGKTIGQLGVYTELVPGKRIVKTESWQDWDPGETLVTVDLANDGGTTLMTNTLLFPTKEVRDMILKSGLEHSVGPMYDNLEKILSSAKSA